MTPTEVERLLRRLRFNHDVRKTPDDYRRRQFRAGWGDASVPGKQYTDDTLNRLTWRNLGYRLGKNLGRRTPEQIDLLFDDFATQYALSKDRGAGWLFMLSASEESNWDSVEGLFESVLEHGDIDPIVVDCPVWGKLAQKEWQPQPGDGFAFYHTSNAIFPPKDPYRRKARISLIGKLLDIEIDNQKLQRIKIQIERSVVDGMRSKPIVNNAQTGRLFRECGIGSGPRGTMFRIPPEVWTEFVGLCGLVDQDIRNTSAGVCASVHDPPGRMSVHTTRVIRDSATAMELKRLYGHCCQVCDRRIELEPGSFYSEVHHIRPLGGPHKGLDRQDNMLVICPTHHAMFDLGVAKFAFYRDVIQVILDGTPNAHTQTCLSPRTSNTTTKSLSEN